MKNLKYTISPKLLEITTMSTSSPRRPICLPTVLQYARLYNELQPTDYSRVEREFDGIEKPSKEPVQLNCDKRYPLKKFQISFFAIGKS